MFLLRGKPFYLSKLVQGLIFVIAVSFACQLLYSHLGFNPTDEGYMLSGSRRLLDGQMPHRDYISLRPVFTQMFHAHFLLWAGERLLWWSRLAPWIEFAVIAWLWTLMIEKSFEKELNIITRFALSVISFVLCAHTFPIMPWNSIDGVFFITIGLAMRLSDRKNLFLISWFLIGLSPLTRQNFYFPILLLPLITGDGIKLRAWLALFSSSIIYGLWLLMFGAIPATWIQLTQHGVYLGPTLSVLFINPIAIPSLLVGLAVGILIGRMKTFAFKFLGLLLLFISILISVIMNPFVYAGMFHGIFLFYVLLGASPFLTKKVSRIRIVMLSLITAWGVAISVGYPSTALASGPLFTILWFFFEDGLERLGIQRKKLFSLISLPLALSAILFFHFGRINYVYRDMNANLLTYDLGGVLRGAQGIKTNRITYSVLYDLNENVKWAENRANGKKVIGVIPDLAQFWVSYPQQNPLSSDWPYNPELSHPKNRARVVGEVYSLRGKAIFIVEKFHASHLPFALVTIDAPILETTDKCAVASAVKSNFSLVRETEFFEVYE